MSRPHESTTFGNALSLRVDGAIGAMSLSPNGRDAVLAGRKGLFIIDLDDPFTSPRWLHHITSWEVADVQWLPHSGVKPSWCVSTLNQKALLWDLARPSKNAIQNVLHRHTRAITDIHFHPRDPELLATCSIDTFVFSWDMRSPRRPANKYAQWRAGATQVKWSSSDPHQLALSHHHSFYVWDSRKGALPLLAIDNAHGGKINGLDFTGSGGRLVTCSNDHTVKFWDTSGGGAFCPEKPELTLEMTPGLTPTIVIHTGYPVARARRLPFGRDSCCGIMPVRGGDNAIHIVNYTSEYGRARALGETVHMDADAAAVAGYSFKGRHSGPMKDFLWRKQEQPQLSGHEHTAWPEYQLVTWSPLDYDLKLWPHERALYDVANYNPQHQVLLALMMGAPEDSSVGEGSRHGTPETELGEDGTLATSTSTYTYTSYVGEPKTSFADFSKDFLGGDLLSRFASYTITRTQNSLARSSQLNHLSWISGVRMGRHPKDNPGENNDGTGRPAEDDGPANLGEEISIVGHKFSKLWFEKISVSTGQIEISLRGPLPVVAATARNDKEDADVQARAEKFEKDKRNSVPETSTTASVAVFPSSSVPGSATNNIAMSITAPAASARQNASFATTSPSITPVEATANTPFVPESAAEQKLIFIRLQISFPKLYPFLEPLESKHSSKKHSKHKRMNQVRFDIEETHELNAVVKKDMLHHLERIAHFYANKYHKYCVEPCLRYLMGERIDLDDSLMTSATNDNNNEDAHDPHESSYNGMEVGNENWVDDLIDQHEVAATFSREMTVSGDEEDDDEDADLIFANNEKMALSTELSRRASSAGIPGTEGRIKHDSTPLPKGCGAMWTNSGELVCFFIPKSHDGHRLSVSQFTGSCHSRVSGANGSGVFVPSEFESGSDPEERGDSDDETYSLASDSSRSSDESFSNDWDEMLQHDIPSRSRMPGIFRGSVALGRRIRIGDFNNRVAGRALTGKGSAYKSSVVHDTGLKSTRKAKKGKRGQSVVSIIDLKHLIPDKYALACDYRVLGESPDMIARHNSEVAFRHGYGEIGQVWRIVEMVLVKKIKLQDLSAVDKDFFNAQSGTSCDFYWGNHPLGHVWLISELFTYFEKRRDLQMLAMLSCLLYENVEAKEAGAFGIPIHTPYPSLPARHSIVSLKEHSILSSEEALVDHESSRSLGLENFRSVSRKPSIMRTRNFQLPRPITPEFIYDLESPSRSASLKPLQTNFVRLESPPFAENFYQGHPLERNARSFENAKQFSRLPPSIRKGDKGVVQHRSKMGSVQREKTRFPPLYTIEIKNAELLDLYEERFSASLLSGIDQKKLLEYREQYAEMLYTWGLPLHRIKILKFNYPQGASKSSRNALYNDHKCSFGSRYRKAFSTTQLLVTPITPIESAKDNAWNTKSRNLLQYCGYCGLIISKRVVICTKCEHIVHSHCAAEWWMPDEPDDYMNECPTGCGCLCLTT